MLGAEAGLVALPLEQLIEWQGPSLPAGPALDYLHM